MRKVFYEKVGRRYKPVSEYDSNLMSAMTKGTHLVQCYPGGQITRYNVDPAYAPMIAAGRTAEETISQRMMYASELRMKRPESERQMTESQRAAWENLVKEFGESARQLEWPSAREVAEAAVKAMQDEAMELLKHESVKQAYEHFLLVCELTKEHK